MGSGTGISTLVRWQYQVTSNELKKLHCGNNSAIYKQHILYVHMFSINIFIYITCPTDSGILIVWNIGFHHWFQQSYMESFLYYGQGLLSLIQKCILYKAVEHNSRLLETWIPFRPPYPTEQVLFKSCSNIWMKIVSAYWWTMLKFSWIQWKNRQLIYIFLNWSSLTIVFL
jgi:hypothetical protein